MNMQTALSQKADYRVTMEFNPLTAMPQSRQGRRRPSNHSRESGYSAASKSHPSPNSVQTPCDARFADR
jgi:hypothetical protein